MADLKTLLSHVSIGAAAEGAREYFGDVLAEMERTAAQAIEAHLLSGDDHKRLLATAEWRAVRVLQRRFARDLKTGREAQRTL
jgi:hypothetical protein